jgi:soluble lytic murein transglycosylase
MARGSAPTALAYDPLVVRVGRNVGIPPALVKAVIHAESAFDSGAVSHKGAMGLMQLMPSTARLLGVRHPFVAEQNVDGGARYLRGLHEQYGSWTLALAAYNAGPAAVDRFGGIPPYRETQTYVRRVLSYYRQYHTQFSR